jgi:hypothetical protein
MTDRPRSRKTIASEVHVRSSLIAAAATALLFPWASGCVHADGEVAPSVATADGGLGFDTTVITLARQLDQPAGIAIDDRYVYWVAVDEAGSVYRMLRLPAIIDVGANAPPSLERLGQLGTQTQVILADDDALYVATYYLPTHLYRMPKSGGEPVHLYSCDCDSMSLAADRDHLYVAELGKGVIVSVPKVGGLATTYPIGPHTASGIAIDRTDIYYAVNETGEVGRIPKHGGLPVTLGQGGPYTRSVAVDGTSAYWACGGTGRLCSTPKIGGQLVTIIGADEGEAFDIIPAIATDPEGVYWIEQYSGRVRAAYPGGDHPQTLYEGVNHPTGLAVDGQGIFWSNRFMGTIQMIPRFNGPG